MPSRTGRQSGRPIAELMADIEVHHPSRPRRRPRRARLNAAEIERIIWSRGAHLLRSFARERFHPDLRRLQPARRRRHGRAGTDDGGDRAELARLQDSTLLFNLAWIFIAHSPARALINPPWRGIAEPMWEPMQIRHRSAYYDAFFTEALLSFVETGLASQDEAGASRRAIAEMVYFCLTTIAEEVPSRDGSTVNVITALAPLPHPWFSASSPISSRISVLVSTCRIATPRRVRSRPRRRLARPIRSSSSRSWISMPETRCVPAPTSRVSPSR